MEGAVIRGAGKASVQLPEGCCVVSAMVWTRTKQAGQEQFVISGCFVRVLVRLIFAAFHPSSGDKEWTVFASRLWPLWVPCKGRSIRVHRHTLLSNRPHCYKLQWPHQRVIRNHEPGYEFNILYSLLLRPALPPFVGFGPRSVSGRDLICFESEIPKQSISRTATARILAGIIVLFDTYTLASSHSPHDSSAANFPGGLIYSGYCEL